MELEMDRFCLAVRDSMDWCYVLVFQYNENTIYED